MKRYTPGQLVRFLSPLVAVTALLTVGRPAGPWLLLGTLILGAVMLIPAFALAFLLRAIRRSPERYVRVSEQTPVPPGRHRPAVRWVPGDLR